MCVFLSVCVSVICGVLPPPRLLFRPHPTQQAKWVWTHPIPSHPVPSTNPAHEACMSLIRVTHWGVSVGRSVGSRLVGPRGVFWEGATAPNNNNNNLAKSSSSTSNNNLLLLLLLHLRLGSSEVWPEWMCVDGSRALVHRSALRKVSEWSGEHLRKHKTKTKTKKKPDGRRPRRENDRTQKSVLCSVRFPLQSWAKSRQRRSRSLDEKSGVVHVVDAWPRSEPT